MGGGHARTPPVRALLFCPAPPLVRRGDARRGAAQGWQWRGHTRRMGGRTRSNGSTRVRMPLFVPSPPLPPPHRGVHNWEGAGPLQTGEGTPCGVSPPPFLGLRAGAKHKGQRGNGKLQAPIPLLAAPGPPPSFCPRPQPPRAVRAPRADPQAPTTCACVHTAPQDPCTPARRPAGTPFY